MSHLPMTAQHMHLVAPTTWVIRCRYRVRSVTTASSHYRFAQGVPGAWIEGQPEDLLQQFEEAVRGVPLGPLGAVEHQVGQCALSGDPGRHAEQAEDGQRRSAVRPPCNLPPQVDVPFGVRAGDRGPGCVSQLDVLNSGHQDTCLITADGRHAVVGLGCPALEPWGQVFTSPRLASGDERCEVMCLSALRRCDGVAQVVTTPQRPCEPSCDDLGGNRAAANWVGVPEDRLVELYLRPALGGGADGGLNHAPLAARTEVEQSVVSGGCVH